MFLFQIFFRGSHFPVYRVYIDSVISRGQEKYFLSKKGRIREDGTGSALGRGVIAF